LNLIQLSLALKILYLFYAGLLSTDLNDKDADKVIRGFVDLHTTPEILKLLDQINKQLTKVEPNAVLGLQLQLAYKSKDLEEIYIHSITEMLKKYNRSDLDDMFFGLIKMNYKNLSPKSQVEVKSYVDKSAKKYSSTHLTDNNDPYFGMAKMTFVSLRNSLQ